jgi:hypothetical protein
MADLLHFQGLYLIKPIRVLAVDSFAISQGQMRNVMHKIKSDTA